MAKGTMNFRYLDQAYPAKDLEFSDFSVGDIVVVEPGQELSQKFLDSPVGESHGKTYYGKTGLSFNADDPKICGQILVVKDVQNNSISFTEQYLENMRNDWNSYFPFQVEVMKGNAIDIHLRYTDQASVGQVNVNAGDLMIVTPEQALSAEFLNSEVGTSDGKTYYGKTGLSFDPNNPKVCGQILVVKSVDASGYVTFTEPFAENMRNDWNSYFPFKARVISGKKSTLKMRYTNQAYDHTFDYSRADLVVVIPGQSVSHEFLNSEVGTHDDKIFYGKTGISFDPNIPKICGKILMVKSISNGNIGFTEPYPENMRNDWNSYFPFEVKIIAG